MYRELAKCINIRQIFKLNFSKKEVLNDTILFYNLDLFSQVKNVHSYLIKQLSAQLVNFTRTRQIFKLNFLKSETSYEKMLLHILNLFFHVDSSTVQVNHHSRTSRQERE